MVINPDNLRFTALRAWPDGNAVAVLFAVRVDDGADHHRQRDQRQRHQQRTHVQARPFTR